MPSKMHSLSNSLLISEWIFNSDVRTVCIILNFSSSSRYFSFCFFHSLSFFTHAVRTHERYELSRHFISKRLIDAVSFEKLYSSMTSGIDFNWILFTCLHHCVNFSRMKYFWTLYISVSGIVSWNWHLWQDFWNEKR